MNGIYLIVGFCFVLGYLAFSKERNRDKIAERKQFEHDSEEMMKVLMASDHRQKLEKIVDRTKGDVANIKILKDTYKLTLKHAKTLWDSIK